MSEHTPGPWRVSDYEFGKLMGSDGPAVTGIDIEHGIGQGLFEVVARIPAPMFEHPCEQDRTNARLIAAAPDLLEACKAVLEWAYTDKWEPTGTFKYFAETVVPLVDDAMKAAEEEK